jgi:methyl-accepting chemotaxis protein
MSLRNATLGTKLALGFGVVIVLLAVVVGIYQFTVETALGGFGDLLIAIEAGQVEGAMLQCRRNEKDFLLRLDEKYLAKLQENVAEISEQAAKIVELAQGSGKDEVAAQAGRVTALAEAYEAAFEGVVSAWEIKGLDRESGLQGEFRAEVRALAESIKANQLDQEFIAYLQIRRYEKDYHRTRADKYETKLSNAIDAFEFLLDSGTAEEAAKEAQMTALEDYREAFAALVAASDKDAQEQHYQKMRKLAHAIEAPLTGAFVPRAGALLLEIRKHEKEYLLRGDKKYVEKTLAAADELLAAFDRPGLDVRFGDGAKTSITAYLTAFNALVAEDDKIAELVATMRARVHEMEPVIEGIYHSALDAAEQAAGSSTEEMKAFSMQAMLLGISAAVIGLVLAWLITRSVTRGINRIVVDLNAGAEQTSSASGQVSASSQTLAQGASEQAAASEELSAQAEQLSEMVERLRGMITKKAKSEDAVSAVPTRADTGVPIEYGTIGSASRTARASAPAEEELLQV